MSGRNMNDDSFIEVDGSILEGGGQILRNAGALCCLLNNPIRVTKIRAGRTKPGLRPQHLSGLQLLSDLSGGRLQGGTVGSTEITLTPKRIRAGNYVADTKTAGSVCLLAQAALPCLFFADGPTQLRLMGGTNAEMAPQIDYFIRVVKPMFQKFGLNFDIDLRRRGFFPKGGGEVIFNVQPVKSIKAVTLIDPGEIKHIRGLSYVAGTLPAKVCHLTGQHATTKIKRTYPQVPVDVECVHEGRSIGNGAGIILTAETANQCIIAGSGLSKRGVSAEDVGTSSAQMMLANLSHAGCVDEYLQDQIIIFMALADGKSQVKCGPISLHTQTAIAIAEQLTKAKFNIQQVNEDENIIECDGCSLVNEQF